MNIELSVIDLLLKDIENEQFFFFFLLIQLLQGNGRSEF